MGFAKSKKLVANLHDNLYTHEPIAGVDSFALGGVCIEEFVHGSPLRSRRRRDDDADWDTPVAVNQCAVNSTDEAVLYQCHTDQAFITAH